MKRFLSGLSLFLLLFGLGQNSAMAAWSFYLDNSNGDNVFELWFRTDAPLILDNYQLNFAYDTGEMVYKSHTNTPPGALTPDLFGAPNENNGAGDLRNFNAAVFLGTGASVSTNIQLGTLTFNVLPGAVQDGTRDLSFAATPGFGVTINSIFYNYRTFQDAGFAAQHIAYGSNLDIGSPVPIPAAGWLLGSGLMALIGLRRRSAA